MSKSIHAVIASASEGADEDQEILDSIDEAIVQLWRRTDPHIPVIFYERVVWGLLRNDLIDWRKLLITAQVIA